MDATAPIACSLAADDYKARLVEIERIGRSGLLRKEETADGAILTFLDLPELEGEIGSIVAAEAACCPFLSLDLARRDNTLILRITGPEEALPVVRDLMDHFGTREA
jgi:hypothetical protein